MPNGDPIKQGATFLSLRSKYKNDPLWPKLEECRKNNKVFECKYHRFWGQSEVLIAMGTYDILFSKNTHLSGDPSPTTDSTPTSTPTPSK